MSNKETPIGKRFSHVYIDRGEPQKDSERFRKRLGGYIDQHFHDYRKEISRTIKRELGVDVPTPFTGYYDVANFMIKSALRDVLDSITVIWNILDEGDASEWLVFVQRVFEEENLGYRVDEQGGVHYFIDEEFERNRVSALSCLTKPRYAAVEASFEDSHSKLDSKPSDTKGSVRSIFEAVEILYKLLIDSKEKDRLNSSGVRSNLKPIVGKLYGNDKTALTAAEHLLDGLCDWIDALHMYRHGQKVEEPSNPPMGLAIQMLSSGATYLRWLAEIDKCVQRK